MNNKTFESGKEFKPKVKVEIEPGYNDFIPQEFKQNPLSYFESKGKNIKTGEVKRDETGRVREDPTAVKELPVWTNANGEELKTIGKRVDIRKGKVGESGDPFYEYKILKIINEIGLPAPKPVAKIEQEASHLIIMEKVFGVGWYEKDSLNLPEKGYSAEDIENLKKQAEEQMRALAQEFERAGIKRNWKLKDMIFVLDLDSKSVLRIIPTDWERTKIDYEKLEEYKNKKVTKPV